MQMDSLADAVSFGVAPALIVYEHSLVGLGKLGWAVAFVYAFCAILRLARFNCNVGASPRTISRGSRARPRRRSSAASLALRRRPLPDFMLRIRPKRRWSSRSTPASRW